MHSSKLTDMILIGLFAALTAVCAQIQIPAAVPFTLQTFAIFLAVGLLGGKRGTASVVIYILLGMVGLPVFAGFKGGIAALLGTTGGYIIGFIVSALLMWALEKPLSFLAGKENGSVSKTNMFRKMIGPAISMIAGLIVCYIFGTAWFVIVYTNTKEPVGIMTALGWCVFPFIIPDLIKIALALVLTLRLRAFVPGSELYKKG
ncbi:MAG: biotin transporter BioY [Lachnospiraceae bacterium]|nr:biotin transporter BioY [Lachnospiraceae bacterium]